MSVLDDEKAALREISNLLPAGYVKLVPFSVKFKTSFEFNGVSVEISAIYYNEQANCYMFDLAWASDRKIYGIPIRCGINILKQYKTPLPNMYAYNTLSPTTEATSYKYLQLFVIDESVLERA